MPFTILRFITYRLGTNMEIFNHHYEYGHICLIKESLRKCIPISYTRYYFNESADYYCIPKLEFRDDEHSTQFHNTFATSPRRARLEADQAHFIDGANYEGTCKKGRASFEVLERWKTCQVGKEIERLQQTDYLVSC
ncbi:hypothetical protein DE146DRAFT_637626 [Phaeosphaeria sp. MPI-PUGE-AT-0046c]|nr:hypothetical protein DE146DRAFT_637626 [Phaeosphaeria sp. MPI-PUGE-AT-0046c]